VLALGNNLLARPWRADDARFLVEAFEDPEIQQWHVRRMDGADEAREWVAQWPPRWENETAASWAVTRRETNQVLGQVGFRDVRLEEGRAQISYWVAPPARGLGVAGQAAAGVTEWAINVLGLQRVGLAHAVANTVSCRVAERAGFSYEGTLRRFGLHADGWHDMHMHARTTEN
jgi:RimJ/RimL family protein N-acetyltransferase